MHNDLFPLPPDSSPKIYAYSLPDLPTHSGCIKIGFTLRNPADRIREQTSTTGLTPRHLLTLSALRPDGSSFTDHDIHALLKAHGFQQLPGGREWFRCSTADIIRAVQAVRDRTYSLSERVRDFPMRPEQAQAVAQTAEYFSDSGNVPRFLWNAKMRFGKTFAAYQLCKRMGFTKILVVTFKPAAESAWSEDIKTHKDFDGWEFVSNSEAGKHGDRIDDMYASADKSRPVVVFGSFQDLMGTNAGGGIKAKNEFIHSEQWDIAIFDEYHFGAWRDNAKKMFRQDEEADADPEDVCADETASDEILPITAKYKLYLSGTPFRALNSGEFIEEQIYSWTYSDEQRAKVSWPESAGVNPYAEMPRMVLMTYKIPEDIRRIAAAGEFDGFDLNEFFAADESGFRHEEHVRKWLRLIRGAHMPFEEDALRLGNDRRPPMPYSDSRLVRSLRHTVWFLPDVAACRAMYRLLKEDEYFGLYGVVLCAGDACGNGMDALLPVYEAMTDNPLETRTITLTCGKLLTGVTVRAWSGIFMLRNLKSPETYFQAAFRVQSPFVVDDEDDGQVVMKKECYVFDFALERALKQVADYSCRLNLSENDPDRKAQEFMNFLPVLAFDGAGMHELDAASVMEYVMTGTSAVLLAKKWQSALLVNVNAETLARLMGNDRAMGAVEKITAFRALNKDIETIIARTHEINALKKKGDPADRPKISEEEKERRKKIQQIKERLMKFLVRIPLFMYLTDEREKTLTDIVREISPELFRRVTGITIQEFDLLNNLGLFNAELINNAIYSFKRYEDSSLEYTGLLKNETEVYGGFDSVIRREDYEEIYEE